MKKSTLFTTLALVVIVALALSTATFAWYSAGQGTVMTNELDVTAAAPGEADIRIAKTNLGDAVDDWKDATAAISLDAANALVPVALVKATQPSVLDDFGSSNYYRASISGVDKTSTFSEDGNQNGVVVYSDDFYVASISTANTNVKATVEVDGTNASAVSYAVFIGNTLVVSNGKWHTAAMVKDTVASAYTGTAFDGLTNSAPLTPATAVGAVEASKVTVYAWLEGEAYYAAEYYSGHEFTLTVTISKV